MELRPFLTDGLGSTYENFDHHTQDITTPGADEVTETSKLTSYYRRETQGYDILNYHKRKAKGELLPFTPFYQTHIEGSADGSFAFNAVLSGITYHHWSVGKAPIDESWKITSTDLSAYTDISEMQYYVQAAAAKIYSGWDALTFAAELTKTAGMFRNFVKRVVGLIVSGNFHKLWLEGRYGWRPLIYDIIEINKLLSSLDDSRQRFREAVGRTSTWTEVSTHVLEWASADYTIHVTKEISVGTRGTVVADIQPPKVQLNIAITAWEIVPYSFVIDWILNVGQFLESMSFLAFSSDYAAAGGFLVTEKRESTISGILWNSGYSGTRTFSGTCVGTLTRRIPSSVSQNPLLKLRLDSLKMLDLMALLKNALK